MIVLNMTNSLFFLNCFKGDSGGPLMLNEYGVWYLIGIVSAGYSCAKQYQPGIYHRVSSSSDWISANIYQGRK